jgi:Na+-transporting methylmalonyl-CoA/oxaloacetate decarboxylase gamma subunit
VRPRAAGAAHVNMNFDLSRHPNAQTDLSLADAKAMAGRGASRAREGGVAAGAAAYKLSGAAAAAARSAGATSYDTVQAFKARWGEWLNSRSSQVNLWFLISNVLYIALGITVLTLTQIVMHEHVDDFKRNEFTQHKDLNSGDVKQYPPCGMPTPDSMYLLQAIGALPAAGWDGASLEPNYKKWMKTVDRALCARIMPGVDVPDYYEDLADCKVGANYVDYSTDHVEELLALGYLMEEPSLTPTGEDYQDQAKITAKVQEFEKRVCLEDEDPDTGLHPLYSEQQRDAYGELKTRVARAYVAAMPAFSRYKNERQACAEAPEYKDPFDSMCKHSCHIRVELEKAADEQRVMWDTPTALPATSFTKQLYRLLALSLAGYYDRYHNEGVCFRNTEVDANGDTLGPIEFCQNSMNMGISTTDGTGTEAITAYSGQDESFAEANQCGVSGGTGAYPPPSPAPPIYRHNKDETEKLAVHTCAATLQYGLFEQGRLFGIPDVLQPFVLDNRVDRSLHFLGEFIYDYMYVKPMEKAGDILADPKSKLELYIAYRMSSTSIWAIMVANVAGFMLVRAALPMGIWLLKIIGVRSTNIESQSESGDIVFKEIQLVRPLIGGPIYLVLFVNALIIYWIFWLDPATQSHYYTTPTCEDWRGLGVQVPSGAFGTTWGKRRYARFGEHVIGILMILLFVLVVAQRIIGQGFVDEDLKKQNAQVEMGETARLDWVAYTMIAFALCIQVLYIAQSIVSGGDWYEAIKASDNDAKMLDVFSRDVLMSVWAAFWTATAIAWFRQKWAVQELPRMYQYAWMVCCLLTLWMPVFQSAVLLEKEIDIAFSDGKGTADTPRLIIYILIYAFSAIWTAILAVRLRAVWKAMPNESASGKTNTSANVRAAKEEGQAVIAVAEAKHAEQQEAESIDQRLRRMAMQRQAVGKFDLSGLNLGPQGIPVRPGRKTDAVYMPLLPAH